jgi:hypothetical protein
MCPPRRPAYVIEFADFERSRHPIKEPRADCFVFVTVVVVVGLFIWAAVKDGQEDKVFRRQTRLGR